MTFQSISDKIDTPREIIPPTRVLAATDYNGPSMLQIPSETLFALLLIFVLLLPILYIGISSLYGIQTPEKFATHNLVVGREY